MQVSKVDKVFLKLEEVSVDYSIFVSVYDKRALFCYASNLLLFRDSSYSTEAEIQLPLCWDREEEEIYRLYYGYLEEYVWDNLGILFSHNDCLYMFCRGEILDLTEDEYKFVDYHEEVQSKYFLRYVYAK